MAEDLDSFFKKKKTKGKKKYTTSDSIKKAVEDSQKVEEQKKNLPNDEDTQTNDPQDDDWIDTKKKEADLTSLKVQSFPPNQSEEQGEAEVEHQSTQEVVSEKESNQGNKPGPWNIPTAAATQTPVTTPTIEPESIAEVQQPNVSEGKYIPPSLRNKPQSSLSRKQPATYKTKKVPDITSQQAFPSLQPAVQNKDSSSLTAQDNDKQTQQHQINMARGIREPIIEHHNRYTALSES